MVVCKARKKRNLCNFVVDSNWWSWWQKKKKNEKSRKIPGPCSRSKKLEYNGEELGTISNIYEWRIINMWMLNNSHIYHHTSLINHFFLYPVWFSQWALSPLIVLCCNYLILINVNNGFTSVLLNMVRVMRELLKLWR